MSFPEFLEGICRLGVMKFDDNAMPIEEKILVALKAVASLAIDKGGGGKRRGNGGRDSIVGEG